MNRRQLLALPALALVMTGPPVVASGANHVGYTRDAYEEAIASGKPFMLDFYASW